MLVKQLKETVFYVGISALESGKKAQQNNIKLQVIFQK